MRLRWPALLACLAGLTAGPAAVAAGAPAILLPGEYHGDEVSATSGEVWLALVLGDGGPGRLTAVALEVDTIVDELVDEAGAATGRRVSGAGHRAAILLFLRNVPRVRAGQVETAAAGVALEPNNPVSLALAGGPASLLELRCQAPRLARGWEEVGCSLVFSSGSREQVLERFDASYHDGEFHGLGSSATATLLWAGDLDGDARIDLVVDLTDHYNVKLPTLFLSPEPGDPQLLVRLAHHRSVGC